MSPVIRAKDPLNAQGILHQRKLSTWTFLHSAIMQSFSFSVGSLLLAQTHIILAFKGWESRPVSGCGLPRLFERRIYHFLPHWSNVTTIILPLEIALAFLFWFFFWNVQSSEAAVKCMPALRFSGSFWLRHLVNLLQSWASSLSEALVWVPNGPNGNKLMDVALHKLGMNDYCTLQMPTIQFIKGLFLPLMVD